MKNLIIEIKNKKILYALIIKKKRRFIKKGVDFLTKDQDLLQLDIKKDKILTKGDIIILFQGGHGFKILEKTNIIEIKQGPYVEGKDKKIIER